MLGGRFGRFLLVGGVTTAVAYVATLGLLRVLPYLAATTLAWAVTLVVGFALNRRFTFGIRGAEHRTKDLALFAMGALLQLAVTVVDFSITLGRLNLDHSLAFAINLVMTTACGFAFQSLVTFRRATARRRPL